MILLEGFTPLSDSLIRLKKSILNIRLLYIYLFLFFNLRNATMIRRLRAPDIIDDIPEIIKDERIELIIIA